MGFIKRKKVSFLLLFGLMLIVVGILQRDLGPQNITQSKLLGSTPRQVTKKILRVTSVPALTTFETKPTDQAIPVHSTSEKIPNLFLVTKVVDGDTIEARIDNMNQKIRLIGIDTPETVDPRKKVQCFGTEASNKAREMLVNHQVILESDPTQGDFDKYGRLLRYVFIEAGTNFNLYMIQEGYAREYTYKLPYKYQAEFKAAEASARGQNKGLWGNVCN